MSIQPKRALGILAAATLFLTACASAGGTLATVNGVEIPEADALALRASYENAASVSGETLRQDATRLIIVEAEKQAAEEEFGLTDLDDPAVIDAKLASPSPEEARLLDSLRSEPDLTEAMVRLGAQQLVIRERVAEALLKADPAYLEEVYTSRRQLVSQVCVRHILTTTRPEIDAVVERLNEGEDFGEIATELSLDTESPEGVLPCPVPAGAFPESFAAAATTAEIGVLTEPVQTEFGWHVLVVDERITPGSVEELQADPLRYMDTALVTERWSAWLDEVVAGATIDVRSDVGIWIPEADGIAPPPGG